MDDWETRMSERTAAKRAVAWIEQECKNVLENDPPFPSEAEVRLNIPTKKDETHCGHGVCMDRDLDIVGDFNVCLCCNQIYCALGSGFLVFGEKEGEYGTEISPHPFLCDNCGGKSRTVNYGRKPE